jgi:hypothetical protein
MKASEINKSGTEKPITFLDDSMQSIYVERLERCMALSKKSNEWKMKYEYYQLTKDITQNSIIVSET